MLTAFIAIDYILDIVASSQGRCTKLVQEKNIIEKLNKGLDIARQKRWLVIFVNLAFSSTYQECPKHSLMMKTAKEKQLFGKGKGSQLHPSIKIQPSDLFLIKHRISAFYETALEPILRTNSIERLLISGVSTSWCVQSTARDAHDRDYETWVVEDLCTAGTQEEHESSIHLLKTIAHITHLTHLGEF